MRGRKVSEADRKTKVRIPQGKKTRVEIPVCTKRKEAIVIKFYHRLVGLPTLSNILYLSNTQKRRVLRGP